MFNKPSVPSITVSEVAQKMEAEEAFVLLDVREPEELNHAKIEDMRVVLAPLSKLAEYQLDAVPEDIADKQAEIVVFCHTGMRSAQVTAWLLQQGWQHVRNMEGGIEAYARVVDNTVGFY